MHKIESRPPTIADRLHFSFENVSGYSTSYNVCGILTVGNDKGRIEIFLNSRYSFTSFTFFLTTLLVAWGTR
jgi:hypothetical protein